MVQRILCRIVFVSSSLLSLLYFVCIHGHGVLAADPVVGEGNFTPMEGDSQEFVQQQIASAAFKSAIDNYLKLKQLDAALFWGNYQKNFETYLAPTLKSLEQEKKHPNYPKMLRLRRLLSEESFFKKNKLASAISSYTVKEEGPGKLMIEATINENLLESIYDEVLGKNKNRLLSNIFVSFIFDDPENEFFRIGINSSELSSLLVKEWKEAVKSASLDQVKRVVGSSAEVDLILSRYLYKNLLSTATVTAPNTYLQQNLEGDFIQDLEKSLQEQAQIDGSVLQTESVESVLNSLWAKIYIRVKRVAMNPEASPVVVDFIELIPSLAIYDLKSRDAIFSKEGSVLKVKPTLSEWYHSHARDKLLQLAIFKRLKGWPSDLWGEVFTKVKSRSNASGAFSKQMVVQLVGGANIVDLFFLQSTLASKGAELKLRSLINFYQQGQMGLMIECLKGSEKDLETLLAQLENIRVGSHAKIAIADRGNPYLLTLKSNR
ncbi:MAG: hypothetical protein HQK52_21170 [Oligoflexia bacterium]|nr:hypothetical protein [Oligoflexia bacterium]